jgi:hypothetical protein
MKVCRILTLLLGLGCAIGGFSQTARADSSAQKGTPLSGVSELTAAGTASGSWEIIPQISVLNPANFHLINDQYVTHYSQSQYGLPAFYVGISRQFAQRAGFEFRAIGTLGYGTKADAIGVSNRDGNGAEVTDSLRLHWLPASVGVKTLYSIPGISFFRPSLITAIGASLIFQEGTLPGVSSTFLLPIWTVTPGLSFFDGQSTDWFGGFNFGFSYLSTFASGQTLHGTSVDLSMNIFL